MAKQIKISDDSYEKIRKMAARSYRTLAGQIDFMVDALSDVQKEIVQLENNVPFQKITVTPMKTSPSPKITEVQTPQIDDLLKKNMPSATPNEELECCANEFQPCKHWVWDINTGEGYINSLSGRVREAE